MIHDHIIEGGSLATNLLIYDGYNTISIINVLISYVAVVSYATYPGGVGLM